jgi:hypothetical protein
MSDHQRVAIVGNPSPEHVGAHLLSAARAMGLEVQLSDARRAWSPSRLVNKLFYHAPGRRPPRLGRFSREVRRAVESFGPDLLLVTGISPPSASAIKAIRSLGVRCVNLLTDDPWNLRNAAGFFWDALREYDAVFSPRRANLGGLRSHGCRKVEYLPFAYNPEVHFPEAPSSLADHETFDADVAIVGGADADRTPLALALADAGLNLRLYGGYWDRVPRLRRFCRGFVYGRDLRMAVGGATANIAMVRRANRDGHAMRSLELPAMGACIVAEDTEEHRSLFGPEGAAVLYYDSTDRLLRQLGCLRAAPELAARLRTSAKALAERGHHTYADRLSTVLQARASGS